MTTDYIQPMTYDELLNTRFCDGRGGSCTVVRLDCDVPTADGSPSLLSTVYLRRISRAGNFYYDHMPAARLLDTRLFSRVADATDRGAPPRC